MHIQLLDSSGQIDAMHYSIDTRTLQCFVSIFRMKHYLLRLSAKLSYQEIVELVGAMNFHETLGDVV